MGARNWGIVVCIDSSYRLDIPVSNPGMDKRFSFLQKPSILAVGPTQPPIQWVLGFFPGGKVAEA
jgi:hypothetical protein